MAAFVLCLAMAAPLIVQAESFRYSFNGDSKPGYSVVSTDKYCVEAGGETLVALDYVDTQNPINTHFTISAVGDARKMGHGALYGTGVVKFQTGSQVGTPYDLEAGRDYFWDPPVNVKGTWEP